MKTRIAILSAIVAVLLLSGIALAQANGRGDTAWNIASASEGYRLTCVTWQVSGTASGGDYRLLEPAAPKLTGNGCCCLYLPLILR